MAVRMSVEIPRRRFVFEERSLNVLPNCEPRAMKPARTKKDSGNGREGIRFAMADYTEERVLVLTGIDL